MIAQEQQKATSGPAYSPPPFYFRQKGARYGVRLAVWTGDLAQLKGLFYDILAGYPDAVEVQLSVHRGTDSEGQERWQEFYGVVQHAALLDTIRRHEALVFQDGLALLCLKIPGTWEYVALDDHGILFIYIDVPEIVELLAHHGFPQREERLLYEVDHWHVSHQDLPPQREIFAAELGLKEHS